MRRAGLLLALVLAGCGGGGTKAVAPAPTPQLDPPQAAEPVGAPPVEKTPPGRVVRVGAKPEGVAIDPQRQVAGVAVQSPPRLVLVDLRTGKVAREVPLPGTARHVSLMRPGGPFLVPVEPEDALVEVFADGRTRTTAVGDNPHDATAIGNRIFVADEFGATLSVVRNGRLVGQVPVDAQPGGVAAVGDQVAVVSVRAYTIELFDGLSDRPEGGGAQSAGLGPSHVTRGFAGRLAIADTRGRALVVYDTRPKLRFKRRIELPGVPVGVAGSGDAWIGLSDRNEAVRVDLDTGKLGATVRTVRDPFSIAESGGVLVVASRSDGTVQIVEV